MTRFSLTLNRTGRTVPEPWGRWDAILLHRQLGPAARPANRPADRAPTQIALLTTGERRPKHFHRASKLLFDFVQVKKLVF